MMVRGSLIWILYIAYNPKIDCYERVRQAKEAKQNRRKPQ
jgi:hypothetical protein